MKTRNHHRDFAAAIFGLILLLVGGCTAPKSAAPERRLELHPVEGACDVHAAADARPPRGNAGQEAVAPPAAHSPTKELEEMLRPIQAIPVPVGS